MSEHGDEILNNEMKEHYDFSKMQSVDRTEFFERLFRERGGRFLDSKLAERFPMTCR